MRSTVVAIVVVLVSCATSAACADNRESMVREHLAQQIATESNGALGLQSMTKTNGFDHEREGMTLYTLEWNATLQIQATGWKAGWRSYQVLAGEPNALAAAVEGLRVSRVVKGGTITLQGKSEFQKADRGWRVLQSEVTAFKVVPPPYALSTFTDLPSFITGCSTTLSLSEADFNRNKFIYADDLGSQAFVVAAEAPTILRFAKETGGNATTPAIKEYSNGPLTVRVNLQPAGEGVRGSRLFRGELTISHGANTTTEKIFGAAGC